MGLTRIVELECLLWLLAGGKLSICQALPLMIDIAFGLEELHGIGISLCDLTPHNVSYLPPKASSCIYYQDIVHTLSRDATPALECPLGVISCTFGQLQSIPPLMTGKMSNGKTALYHSHSAPDCS